MSIVFSLAISTFAATTTLWLHEWHPVGLFEIEAALSVAVVSISKSRSGEQFSWPRLHWADLLLPVSVALWGVGVARTNVSHLGLYGLPAILPLIFYVGLGLLVVSATIALAQNQLSRLRMALHAVALVVMLYGTAALVYQEGRYAWLYKTIGPVQYINYHGTLNTTIDIYQNWPGFFAFAAWFDKIAGVASPLAYAKWVQLVVELAVLPLLYLSYRALALPVRQCWIGVFLYSACNWIGQDYFSPQALGTILSLGIMAIALRWMYSGNSSWHSWHFPQQTRFRDSDGESLHGQRLAVWLPFALGLVFLFGVLTFTHELSPYLVILQLGSLAVLGRVRPRWLPLVLVVVAIGYFVPHFEFVNSHFGLLSSIGNFFGNAAPPSSAATWPNPPPSEQLITRCSELLSLGVWALALVGAWMRRRSLWLVISLLLLSFSPIAILAAGAYGDEGVLRVYLFSLPWSAALASAALSATPALVSRRRHIRDDSIDRPAHALTSGLRMAAAIFVALILFFPAFFGDDRANIVSPPEVGALQVFQQTAKPGVVYAPTTGCPFDDTARYNLFDATSIFGPGALVVDKLPEPNIAGLIARNSYTLTGGAEPTYVITCPSALQYNASHPVTYPVGFTILLNSLARSPQWVLLVKKQGTIIYGLRSTLGSSAG